MQMIERFLFIPAFMLVAALLLGGCSDSDDGIPVQLRVDELPQPSTGASQVVDPFRGTVAISSVSGEYSGLSGAGGGLYGISVGADGSVSWNPVAHYPSSGSWIYLVAVSPAVSVVPPLPDGAVSYTLTGVEDLLYAREISGNKWNGSKITGNTDAGKDKPLAFEHLLARLQLKACKAQNGGVAVNVTKVTVCEAKTSAKVFLSDGTAEFASPSGLSLDLSGSKSKAVVSTTAVELGDLLLPPLGALESYTLDVETSAGNYSGIRITFGGASAADLFRKGKSHEVTLTISDHSLEVLSVTATPWTLHVADGELDLMP